MGPDSGATAREAREGPANVPVLVVGAGPTGLMLALQLARRGVRPRIIDRNEGPARQSRAMGVQARTLEFYQQLGFADEIVAAGVPTSTVRFLTSGREAAHFSLADMGAGISPYPYLLGYPQDQHERLLAAKLRDAGVEVEWGVELTALHEGGDGVRVTLRHANGEEEVCEAAYLVGCDGGRSRVRQQLGIEFAGGHNEALFYVADVAMEGADGQDVRAQLDADTVTLVMPVRTSGMQRLIGIVPRRLADRTDLTFDDVAPTLDAKVTEVNWFSTYHVSHRVAERFRQGRCFLAGDAGHVHSPTGGQGMNTGLGDAVNLGWKLADVVRGRAGASLLDTYEPERIAFARTLVATTDAAFQRLVAPGRAARLLRTRIAPRALGAIAGLPAVRPALFRTISQVRITYRASALSEGKAGAVAGGDRLPWVHGEGSDNFAPLATLDWQVHVYGSADPGLTEAAAGLGLALHVFPWSRSARRAGLKQDAAYVVRPDGYVALATARPDAAGLRAYADKWDLQLASPRSAQIAAQRRWAAS